MAKRADDCNSLTCHLQSRVYLTHNRAGCAGKVTAAVISQGSALVIEATCGECGRLDIQANKAALIPLRP